MQNNTDIRGQLREYRAQLAAAEAEASLATRRVNFLRQVVDGLKGLAAAADPVQPESLFQPPVSISPDDDTDETPISVEDVVPLRGREAVRQVLLESRRAWKIPDLSDEIQRRGWMPGVASPRDATAASVQRLVTDGEAERVGHGVYRLRLDRLPVSPTQEVEETVG